MKRVITLSLGLLAVVLVGCGSGEVKPGGASLKAQANVQGQQYTFDCDPAAAAGMPIILDNDISFSCNSLDGNASLTVFLQWVTDDDGNPDSRTSVVLTVFGPPVLNYSGPANITSSGRLGNKSVDGSFEAHLLRDVSVIGDYSLNAD